MVKLKEEMEEKEKEKVTMVNEKSQVLKEEITNSKSKITELEKELDDKDEGKRKIEKEKIELQNILNKTNEELRGYKRYLEEKGQALAKSDNIINDLQLKIKEYQLKVTLLDIT